MPLNSQRLEQFFALARERETIRRMKDSGHAPPWTNDPVFRGNYFCNVFREDDRTTRWFRENIRDPLKDTCRVELATIIFRWFNYIPTGELIRYLLVEGDWSNLRQSLETILVPVKARGEKLFTGAFIVKSPNGKNKLAGILDCIEAAPRILADGPEDRTLRAYHTMLQRVPYLGPFMAYQVVCDLRFTSVLEKAPDIDRWTAPGPGSARGLAIMFDEPVRSYTSASQQALMVERMIGILGASGRSDLWPPDWREWELSTVQHWLCEFDKYVRAASGERMKRKYPVA
jgi:hypothetical protein